MKTSIRLVLAIAVLFLSFQKLEAQCAASDILIQNLVPTGPQTAGSCHATFDLSFTMQNNNGNKFIYLHAWKSTNYPDYFQCSNGQPGTNGTIHAPHASDLGNTFLNIGIDNSGATPVILTTYAPDPTVVLNSVNSITETTLPNGSSFFVLHGVTATFPATCGTPLLIIADFWSSQAANSQNAQCVSCHLTYALNFVNVVGFTTCNPLAYQAIFVNQQAAALTGTYSVYQDINNDGFLSTSVDSIIVTNAPFSLGAGAGTTLNVSGPIPNDQHDLLFVVNLSVGGTEVFLISTTPCAPLPVAFISFNANRTSRANVSLTWQTAQEINNSGFSILRNLGPNWQVVAFVPSQAVGGNSSSALSYSFNDLNSYSGISQYRIRQVDLDGKSKFTDIRSVRGFEQKGKTIVYPNPSSGDFSVVFEDSKATRDVSLIDMNGRVVKEWKAVTGNTIQVTGMTQGVYSVRIVARETNEVTTEKVVVAKGQ